MAFCSNCGNELRDGAKFCPKCGHQDLDEQLAQVERISTLDDEEDEEEHLSMWMRVACITIPMVGAGVFVYNWRRYPEKAELALKYAFLATCVSMVLMIYNFIKFVINIMTVFHEIGIHDKFFF